MNEIPWIGGKRKYRVAVIGDVILDEYLDGQVNRISPEAPVPVHLVKSTVHGAGGAANVARNIKLAGGEVYLLSVLGEDDAAKQLKALLAADGISTKHMVTVDDRPTIRKTRITSNSHQMVRIDWERVHPISAEAQEKLLQNLRGLEFDALLVSDYAKGTMTHNLLSNALELAVERGVPSTVDPKGRDFSKYLRATLVKPNRKEAIGALGLDPGGEYSGEELGRRLQRAFGIKNVLVTLGPKGMALVPAGENEPTITMPSIPREVYDVSGAGDAVISMITLGLACKAPLADAMHIANTAGALVVEKWGTQPVRLSELQTALRESPEPGRHEFTTRGKVVDRETLRIILKEPEARDRKVVFTNGCFDLIHAGHVTYLEEARSRGDVLVVGVNSDDSVRALKGKTRPYVDLGNRMRMLASLSAVDYVVPFSEETPYDLINALVPDVLIKGGDYDAKASRDDKTFIVGSDVVRAAGGKVETIDLVPGLSTSALSEKIRRG
jgi:D-beta-D-heptose 7-phosphate kinase/D-beta-D-heptose 1-phosphate adenosyltransferase